MVGLPVEVGDPRGRPRLDRQHQAMTNAAASALLADVDVVQAPEAPSDGSAQPWAVVLSGGVADEDT